MVGTREKHYPSTMPHRDVEVPPGQMPRLSGDIRHLIPKLGLRNYWYPAIPASKVKRRKPVRVQMIGETMCMFRAKDGRVVAIQDVCPHRGASLSRGKVHWPGTVTCPYHGWVFDETGKNVAVLTEGPNSIVCGKPGTECKLYPTRELKGIVFVWIGDEAPAPIEEDVPEEFFNPKAYIFHNNRIIWHTNWMVALENSLDSHVSYLHRDHLQALLAGWRWGPRGAGGGSNNLRPKVIYTGNGLTVSQEGAIKWPDQDVYPNGWKWPQHLYRRWWAWFFAPLLSLTRVNPPPIQDRMRWGMGHRLPGMFRIGSNLAPARKGLKGLFRFGGAGLFGLYTRQVVAVEEWKTRVWYYHYTQPKTWLELMWYRILYWGLHRWLSEYNFSEQDSEAMPDQRYDWPEKLSGTDAEVVQWRKLVVTKHFGGRNAPFDLNRHLEDNMEDMPRRVRQETDLEEITGR